MKNTISVDSPDSRSYDPQEVDGRTSVAAPDALLTVQEICDLLRVPKTYVYWLTHQKKIPHLKIGGHLRFKRSEVDAWLKSQEVQSVSLQKGVQVRR